jgi:hypothetical protein
MLKYLKKLFRDWQNRIEIKMTTQEVKYLKGINSKHKK